MGDQSKISASSLQTRAVVWGNHSEATNHAIRWLNDHQFLVVDRWVEKESSALKLSSEAMAQRYAHMVSMAQKVGASFLVFVQVNEKPHEQKVPSLSFNGPRPKVKGVEIRGMDAETAAMVLGAKAWSSEPLAKKSDQLVTELTTLALQEAFKNPQPSLSPQHEVPRDQKQGEHAAVFSGSGNEKTPGLPPASQSMKARPTPNPHPKNADRSLHLESEKKTGGDVTTLATPTNDIIQDAEPQTSQLNFPDKETSSEDSSIGLRIASGGLSVLYTPFKLTYAVLGGFFGGFAYIFTAGNEEVAQTIWDSSLGGTYWLRPVHLRGDQPIDFRGQPKSIEG